MFGFIIADIPGLIEGASDGKGLGHKFLKHVSRTKMLLHLVSLENEDPVSTYYTIRDELSRFDESLTEKEEWIILTKKDLVEQAYIEKVKEAIAKIGNRVFVISKDEENLYKELQDSLTKHLNTK